LNILFWISNNSQWFKVNFVFHSFYSKEISFKQPYWVAFFVAFLPPAC